MKDKLWKPRVVILFNTGTRTHVDKKKFSRKEKHRKGLTAD
jgi:hypothetical protein